MKQIPRGIDPLQEVPLSAIMNAVEAEAICSPAPSARVTKGRMLGSGLMLGVGTSQVAR